MATPRPPWEYPEQLQYVLELISIGTKAKVVGSYAYQNHAAPSDADCYEVVKVNLDRAEAAQYYAKRIQGIIRQISVYDQIIFRDFKAGFNPDYQPDFDKIKTQAGQREYIDSHKFTVNETAELTELISNYYAFSQKIRQYYILHWTAAEVLAGVKTSRGFTVTLSEAILMPTIIKLDVVSWVKDRFVSVEILYNLMYLTTGSNPLNPYYQFIFPPPPYSQSILDDIVKYSQPGYFQPLKVLKRLWNLARLNNCPALIAKIDPILQGPVAGLNQIASDIDTIIFLLQNQDQLGAKAINLIFTELLTMEGRVVNNINLTNLNNYVSFSQFYDLYLQNPKRFDQPDKVITWLEQLEDSLGQAIQPVAAEFNQIIQESQVSCNGQDPRMVMELFGWE